MKEVVEDRHKLIITSLIKERVLTLKDLKNLCGVSERTISKDLNVIEGYIRGYRLNLVRKPKVGIWIEGEPVDKRKLLIVLSANNFRIPATPKERQDYIILKLIQVDDYITVQELSDSIYTSRSTLEKDLNIVDEIARQSGLILERTANRGIRIVGDEKNIRMLLADFFSKITYTMPANEFIRYINSQREDDMYIMGNCVYGLLSGLDLKAIEELIIEVERQLGYKFSDVAFTSLLICIAITIKRVKCGHQVSLPKNVLKSLENTREFKISGFVLRKIEKLFSVKFSDMECGYVTMHILGANIQYDLSSREDAPLNNVKSSDEIEDMCIRMVNRASQVMLIDFTKDNTLLKGLSVHMHSAVNRLLYKIPIRNPLLDDIKNSYITSFEAAVAASEVVSQLYKVNVNEHEIAYIALHFETALERMRNNITTKKKILVVCSSGIGISQLIAVKLKRIFEDIDIVGIISSFSIDEQILKGVDFIITNVPLMIDSVPVIMVNPLLNQEDIENIKRYMLTKSSDLIARKKNRMDLLKLIDRDVASVKSGFTSKAEVIEALTSSMAKRGYVKEDFYISVIGREKIASTATGRIALPHGDISKVYRSVIGICTLDKKIDWDDCKVDFVIMLAIKKDDIGKMQNIFNLIYDIFFDNKTLNKILNCNNIDEIFEIVYETI